ncbi:MAG TPA: cupin domain-containing protein [Candidatus Binataceae bacterium]|nr:cupin domain-containing protein [Candidatus Binataceae bacterium]
MSATESAWVLGHKVRRWCTDDAYGLIEVVSPPRVPGPPPHFHRTEREFFFIMRGKLDVMVNGDWRTMGAGDWVELPAGAVHTFINNTGDDTVWVTGWRPKGFERFFAEFGVPTDTPGARELSTSDGLVQRVAENCERFGMYISR